MFPNSDNVSFSALNYFLLKDTVVSRTFSIIKAQAPHVGISRASLSKPLGFGKKKSWS
jgi:hypothetical protein